MTFSLTRYACVTLRHAISRDVNSYQRGFKEGAATGSKRNACKPVTLTFRTLETEIIKSNTDAGAPMSAVLRNRKSKLNKALAIAGLTADQPAKLLLGPALEATIALVRAKSASPKAASDTVSALRWFHEQAEMLFPGWSRQDGAAPSSPVNRLRLERQFSKTLRAKIKAAGLSQADAAKLSGVPLPTLQGWLKGVRPSRAALSALQAVADVLQTPVGDFLQFVRRTLARDLPPPEKDKYSRHLSKCRQLKYRLQLSEVTDSLRQEWERYMAHQVGEDRTYRRGELNGWRKKEWDHDRGTKLKWFESYHGMYVPSANANWGHLQRLVGFVRLAKSHGGMEVDPALCQTMAWFAQPNAVRAHLEWLERRAGENNTGVRNFRQVVHSLVVRDIGWLRQQPEMMERLPERFRAADWDALCDETIAICKAHSNKKVVLTRNALRSLRPLLAIDDPLDPLYDAIEELCHDAEAFPRGSIVAARSLRNAALMALLLTVPLRLETVIQLTIGPGGHLDIRDGELFLDIPESLLKNGTKRGPLVIDGLQSELVDVIGRYIELARPQLLKGKESDRLFVSSRGYMWTEASTALEQFTRRYLHQYMNGKGLCMHSFRHLVASRYLKLHPDQYEGVAVILHDNLQTVLDIYAPKDPTGAFQRNAQRRGRLGAAH